MDTGKFIIPSELLFKAYISDNFKIFSVFLRNTFDKIRAVFYVCEQIQWVIIKEHAVKSTILSTQANSDSFLRPRFYE